MDTFNNAKALYRNIKNGNHYQTVNNEKQDFYYNDIESSVISQQAHSKANHTTTKNNFKPLIVDDINHKSRNNIAPEMDGRNIEVLTGIRESQVIYKPHNVFKSDFAVIEY